MADIKEGFSKTFKFFGSVTGQKRNLGFGGSETEALGFHDPKPYKDIFVDGRFRGYDGSLWQFFKAPEGVKIEDVESRSIAVRNQAFFVDFIDQIGAAIIQTDKTTGDVRRKFQTLHVVDFVDAVTAKEGTPPRQRDYLSRVPVRRPMWTGYIGVELLRGSGYSEAYGLSQKIERWYEMMTDEEALDIYAYEEDRKFIQSLAQTVQPSLMALDFHRNPDDLERLTAWHGVSDEEFALDRALQNTRFAEPIHGNSLISERWGEITVSAITPMETVFMSDPADSISRWATPIFSPPAQAVAMWTRGEIRASGVAAAVMDNKLLRKQEAKQQARETPSQRSEKQEQMGKIDQAMMLAQSMKHSMLDNVEILVATRISDNGPGRLKALLRNYDMTLSTLRLRQPEALLSSFPTYPNSVFRAPRTNVKRAKLSNQMFAGALAMSGLFRNTGTGDPDNPIFLGFVDSMYEYKEISMGLTDAYRLTGAPLVFVNGATGSGKALSLDTKIMTPDGYVLMRDVEAGRHKVIGGDGRPCNVTMTTDVQRGHDVFRLTFEDGQKQLADRDHQWLVEDLLLAGRSVDGVNSASENQREFIKNLLDGFAEDDRLTAEELFPALQSILRGRHYFNTPEAVSSALAFTDCPVAEDGTYNAREALEHICERLIQRQVRNISTSQGVFEKITTGELYDNRFLFFGTAEARYRVPTQAIEYDYKDLPVDAPELGKNFGWVFTTGHVDDFADDNAFENLPYSSIGQRQGFLRGFMQEVGYDGDYDDEGVRNYHTPNKETADFLARITRSLGIRTSVSSSDEDSYVVSFYHTSGSYATVPGEYQGNRIIDIEPVDSVPVRCITVDSPDYTYMIEGGIVTSNTQTILQMSVQVRNMNFNQVFLNPKPQASLAPFFKAMEGLVVNFGARYLDRQPGLLDLFNFYVTVASDIDPNTKQSFDDEEDLSPEEIVRQNRNIIANKIAADVAEILDTDKQTGPKAKTFATKLRAVITENTLNPLTRCTGDVLFGVFDSQGKMVLPGINSVVENLKGTDDYIDLEHFIKNRMKTSAVWRAMISMYPIEDNQLVRELKSGKPILIEWDGTFQIPEAEKSRDNYTDDEIDSILSVQTVFMIAVQTIGADRTGGALFIDEAWSLKSPQVMALLTRSGREWRQYNIAVILSTQYIHDLVAKDSTVTEREGDLGKSISRYLFLCIGQQDKKGLEMFYDITGIPRSKDMDDYMTSGRVKFNKETGKLIAPPHGFWADEFHGTKTKIIMGPYPEKELNLGRTDYYGEEARRNAGLYIDPDDELTQGLEEFLGENMESLAAAEDKRTLSNMESSTEEEEQRRFSGVFNRRKRTDDDDED